MEIILFIPLLISFFLTFFALPKWIKKCNQTGLLWEDMNKPNHPKNVAGSGGIIVVMAFIIGVLSYLALRTFVLNANEIESSIFSLLGVILILAIVGLVDDLFDLRKYINKNLSVLGLSVRFRIFLAFIASIPLVVINAGTSTMAFPFIGVVHLGLLYPLLIIPFGVAGATITYNFLAGFNGLETGQGIIILSFLSFVAYVTGTAWLTLIGLIMISSLIVFYFYNKSPAKVFPGDSLTWSIGALIAIMAILGNFEKIAAFIFIPYILEMILKLRGGLKKQSFAKPNPDGSLEMPYNKIYGLTHLSLFILKKLKRKVYEKDVTYLIFIFQIMLCLLALIIFRGVFFI
jgi:UDP-N-acetylglucosamine--dolichyl-phosphate N-acetylglucosaminephosphotransferase